MRALVAAMLVVSLIACSQPGGTEGPAGPVGPQGAPGVQGEAGAAGSAGLHGLVEVTSLAIDHPSCPTGGAQIDVGVDLDADGVLDENERDSTRTRAICNGALGPAGLLGPEGPAGAVGAMGPTGSQGLTGEAGPAGPAGPSGATGAAGADGLTALVATVALTSGDTNCPSGGTQIHVGLDSDRDGTLDPSEINHAQTGYACNGNAANLGELSSLTIVTDAGTTFPGARVVQVKTTSNLDLLRLSSSGTLVVSGTQPSRAMIFQAETGALRAGSNVFDLNQPLARDSVALGQGTATGVQSFSVNGTTTGVGAIALGSGAQATADDSLALGPSSIASGLAGVAIGPCVASGSFGTCIGLQNTASGNFSTAIGKNADTNNKQGAVVISDGSAQFSTDKLIATANNQVSIRGSGGIRLFTSMNLSTGCNLDPGGGTWNCTSDRAAKKEFQELDAEEVLAKLSRMHIQSWAFRNDEQGFRHVGPVAQDFHAAFGLGSSDRTIGAVDADGINMLAIQALEKRTAEVKQLRDEVAEMKAQLKALTQRLDGAKR